jgi:hypothetical protein
MFEHWHEFYTLLGTAAAALVALLFVAISLAIGFLSSEQQAPTRTFTSPVLAHYTYLLFVSLLVLMPIGSETVFAAILGLSAATAMAYSSYICVRVLRSSSRDLDDRFAYGASPPVAYTAIFAAACFIYARWWVGPPLLAAALLLLLLVNIRNAWDLTVFFVQRRTDSKKSDT